MALHYKQLRIQEAWKSSSCFLKAGLMSISKVRTEFNIDERLPTLCISGGKYTTALQAASSRGHTEIVELLRQHGATL
jgi:ankyrin repeat protein